MSDLLDTSPQALAHVHYALRSGGAVRQRGDVFLWSQGPVQACLPHALMACALFDPQGNSLHMDCFHSSVIDAHVLEAVMAPQTGLLTELALLCEKSGGVPLLIDHPVPADSLPRPRRAADKTLEHLSQRCAQMALGPALVVSTGTLHGSMSSYFVFFKLSLPTVVPPLELATLFLPHFHLALCRSWAAQAQYAERQPPETLDLTKRQLQILNWVQQGKTNFEIAVILELSPLTVKNHLQKLFKRLNVHNRTQAVAKRMAESGASGFAALRHGQ